jgi:hypothetical protein
VLVDQRPDDGVVLAGSPVFSRRSSPPVEECPERRGVHRVLDVGVAQHDHRVVAAQLQQHPLQVAAGRFGEPTAGGRGAGEVDAAHQWVLDQLVADRAGLPGAVRDDVEHPVRQPGLAKISPHSSPPTNGDSSDGLATTVLPRISGAASERADRIRAAFQGAIAPTTPTGRRMPIANVPGTSEGMTSPIGL